MDETTHNMMILCLAQGRTDESKFERNLTTPRQHFCVQCLRGSLTHHGLVFFSTSLGLEQESGSFYILEVESAQDVVQWFCFRGFSARPRAGFSPIFPKNKWDAGPMLIASTAGRYLNRVSGTLVCMYTLLSTQQLSSVPGDLCGGLVSCTHRESRVLWFSGLSRFCYKATPQLPQTNTKNGASPCASVTKHNAIVDTTSPICR